MIRRRYVPPRLITHTFNSIEMAIAVSTSEVPVKQLMTRYGTADEVIQVVTSLKSCRRDGRV